MGDLWNHHCGYSDITVQRADINDIVLISIIPQQPKPNLLTGISFLSGLGFSVFFVILIL
ncbi:hypothetical protein VCR9J2_900113 [Vibrio crassostreae]|nr:hypothetical protein VCR9J2_900113 [Vibrio crassostreae]